MSREGHRESDAEHFRALHDHLEQTHPLVHRSLEKETINDLSLLYTWQGADPSLDPILLMAHLDVVPVDEELWSRDPFGGEIQDGYLWGRGAMDDKLALMAVLAAVEHLIGAGFTPRRSVLLAFGHDEEIGGAEGAGHIAQTLDSRGVRFQFVLDEGGAVVEDILPGVEVPVALVGIAEKGGLTVGLTAHGQPGHSAMPPPSTAIGTLAAALTRLERSPMPARIGALEPTFRFLAPRMSLLNRVLLANMRLTGGLVERRLAKDARTDALMRTTTAITVIEGGERANVLPARASATVNFRIIPGDSVADVLAHVSSIVGPDIEVSATPRKESSPGLFSRTDSPGFRLVQDSIAAAFPGAAVAPWVVSGATDSRYFTSLADDVYRFAPFRTTAGELRGLHGPDERVRLADATAAVGFYVHLMRSACG